MKLMSKREVGLWREGGSRLLLCVILICNPGWKKRGQERLSTGRQKEKEQLVIISRGLLKDERDMPPTSEFEKGREVGEQGPVTSDGTTARFTSGGPAR